MYQGDVVVEAGVGQLFVAPKHPYTQRLLASLPVPDPIEQGKRRSALASLKAAD